VAALAVGRDCGMIEAGRAPAERGMAITAFLDRLDVSSGDRLGTDTGVAAAARARRLRYQIDVLRTGGRESVGGMAGVAVVVARDMVRALTLCDDSIVTTETAPPDGRMVDAEDGREVVKRVTQLAIVLRGDVSRRPRCRADSRPDRVTAHAASRCTLEDTILVTVFARQVAMESQ
jgi:hypothetical protein